MQNTVSSEKGGSQMPWKQARGICGMLFYRSYFALTRRLKEFSFFQPPQQDFAPQTHGTTRQVCRAGGSPHSSWVQDRWEGRELLRDLLQPGNSSVHSNPSWKALAESKHFKKSRLSPFPKKSAKFFLCKLWPVTQEALIVKTWSESLISLLVGVILSQD